MNNLDPRTKITLALTVSLLSITLDHASSLGLLAVVCFIVFLATKPKAVHLRGTILFFCLTVWGVMLSQGIFYQGYPRTVVFTVVPAFDLWGHHCKGLYVFQQGLWYGAVQSLRFVATLSAGLALCLSTSPQGLFKGLTSLKVPYSLSFLAVIAVRFLPAIAEELNQIRRAMALKGYKPFKSGFAHTIKTELSCALPLLAGTVRRSREMAESLLLRGFNPAGERTLFSQSQWEAREKIFAVCIMGMAVGAACARILFWLYEQDIYYNTTLRPLYSLVRFYL